MDQKRIKAIFLLIIFQNIASLHGKDLTPAEGSNVEIECAPPNVKTPNVLWLRVVDNGAEFIGTFSHTGVLKSSKDKFDDAIYNVGKMSENKLKLRKFNSQLDSGVYSCAAYTDGVLLFGEVTRLQRAQGQSATPAPTGPATKANTSPMVCTCAINTDQDPSIWACSPIILGSLACGYGVISLLFIITIVHCNRIRTRRCPHHYKRQKQRRKVEGEHAMEN